MSEPSTVAATAPTPGRPWGQRWLDRCDDADRFGSAVIEVGRTYALHDWQLELHLEPGRAETTARSGPRVRHEVVATHPPLDDDTASTLLDLIAGSGTQTAALLDRELEPDLLERAADLGVDLLPDPSRLDLVCSCPHHDGVCKHQAAILFLLADAFDEQPFDLLLFRGLPHAELVERVARRRRGESDKIEPGDHADAGGDRAGDDGAGNTAEMLPEPDGRRAAATPQVDPAAALRAAWHTAPADLPPPLPEPAEAHAPDWGAPPESAPFTADGLRELVLDAMTRARAVAEGASPLLDLDIRTDLARRIADGLAAGDDDRVRSLTRSAGISPAEARARARGWERGASAGVEAVVDAVETIRLDDTRSARRLADGRWFTFVKESGRWQLDAGPYDTAPLNETGNAQAARPSGVGDNIP